MRVGVDKGYHLLCEWMRLRRFCLRRSDVKLITPKGLAAYICSEDCGLKRPVRIGRSKPDKNHFPSVYIAWSLSYSVVSSINDNFSRDILPAYCQETRSWVHSNFGWSREGVPDPPIVTFSNWSPLGVTLYLFVFHLLHLLHLSHDSGSSVYFKIWRSQLCVYIFCCKS